MVLSYNDSAKMAGTSNDAHYDLFAVHHSFYALMRVTRYAHMATIL